MGEKIRILIVDDEPQIRRVLRTSLAAQGYDLRTAADGETAIETFGDWPPDLVVTDLSMPNMGGVELCQKLRAVSQTPIIVLSIRGEEKSKIEALDAGADDYVTKPFSIAELLARIRAALRRGGASHTDGVTSSIVKAGDFLVDLQTRIVTIQGREVHLTPREYDLMVYLLRHPGKVLTHRTLLASIWGSNSVDQTEYLRVFVGQLRKKIEPNPSLPRYILTEPWVGYRFKPGE
jgi:two-component system, OmpR family, KDP operon response regulator KdpE